MNISHLSKGARNNMGTKQTKNIITRIRNRYSKRAADKSGQTLTEYVLILALVFMIAVKLKNGVIGKVEKSLNTIDTAMDQFESEIGQ